MIQIIHQESPRKLASRKTKGIPENPRNAWNNFKGKEELRKALTSLSFGLCAYCENRLDTNPVSCGHSPLKKENAYDEELFIQPTELNVEKYFSFEVNGKLIPTAGLSTFDTQRVEHAVEVLNLNCNRLVRQRHNIIIEGYEIISSLKSDDEINDFISLETDKVRGKYLFPFVNLRKQHFEGYN